MSNKDKLISAIDKAIKPSVQLTDNLIVQSESLAQSEKNASLTAKAGKSTTIKLARKGDSFQLSVTKKF